VLTDLQEDKLIYPLSDRVAKQCALCVGHVLLSKRPYATYRSLVAVSVDGAPGLPSSALRPS
jgi:hypothetical protein